MKRNATGARAPKARLLAGTAVAAMVTALSAQAAWATPGYTAGSEAELQAAIAAINASANPGTIQLTGDFAITNPAALPAASQSITIDMAGHALTGAMLTVSGPFTVSGGGQLGLTGTGAMGDLSLSGSTVRLDGGGKLSANVASILGTSTLGVSGAGSLLTATQLDTGNTIAGTATIRIDNGGAIHVANSTSSLARVNGSHADLIVTGAGSRLDMDGGLSIGSGGTGTTSVMISGGGTVAIGARLSFGSPGTGGPSDVQVTGAGSSLAIGGKLGVYRGSLAVLDGAKASAGSIDMGGTNQTSSIVISGAGSSFTSTGDVILGANVITNSTSTITLADGGAFNAGGAFTVGGAASTRNGVLNIGTGAAGPAAGAGTLNAASVTLTAGTGTLTFNHTDTDYTFAAAIGGGGTINHYAGVTHLTGDSSGFSGLTTVWGGDLRVDGKLGGPVSVEGGARLGGDGTIGGDVIVSGSGGVLAPGNSPGTLTIDGDLTLQTGSHLAVEFGQSNVVGGPLNDLVKVGGSLILGGTVDVSVSPGGVFDAGLYRIATYGGTLFDAGFTLGSTPAGSTVVLQTAIAGQVNLVNTAGLAVNFWDGDAAGHSLNGFVDGGDGVWTAGATNWTIQSGGFDAAYDPNAFAIFAAAPGAVTVSGPVGASGMQFAVDGYRLSGGAITLNGASATIRVGDGTTDGAGYVATIDDVLTGSAQLVKTDLGTLTLTADNTYTGGTLISAGTLQLGNGGTTGSIKGDVTDNGTLAFDRSDDVTFAATISGAGAVSQRGPGTLTLTGANSYSGGTVISAGTLRAAAANLGSGTITDNAALVIDQPTDAAMAMAIDGAGALTKAGAGRLDYTGTGGFTGSTAVAGGTLAVNGSLANSAVTVQAGARLGGNGTVGATTIQSGGVVAPGNSIGTLHVNGAFAQAAGSIYEVELDPAGASDLIAATGAATLAGDAGLKAIKAGSGSFRIGTVYTILSADGGLSGTWGLTNLSAFLGLQDSYDANHAYLTVVQTRSLTDAAGTSNQQGVAGAIPSGSPVDDALLNLSSDAAAQHAFDQLSGEALAASKGVVVNDSRLVRDLATDRVRGMLCAPGTTDRALQQAKGCLDDHAQPTAWAQGFGAWGHSDSTANASGAQRSTSGFLIGADMPLASIGRAGVFAGYSHTGVDVDSGVSDIDSYHAGLYGGLQRGPVGLRAGASFTYNAVDSTRQVAFDGFQDRLKGDYAAYTSQGYAEAGYELATPGPVSVEGFANVAYASVHSQGFTEKGGPAALTAAAQDTGVTYATLGVRPSIGMTLPGAQVALRGMVGWRSAFGDITPTSRVAFAGGPAFTVAGVPLARNSAVAEFGADLRLSSRAVLGVTYAGQYSARDVDQSVRAVLSVRF